MVRVRACIKCREFMHYHNTDYPSQQSLKRWEELHKGHTMATINKSELADVRANEKPFKNVRRASV